MTISGSVLPAIIILPLGSNLTISNFKSIFSSKFSICTVVVCGSFSTNGLSSLIFTPFGIPKYITTARLIRDESNNISFFILIFIFILIL